MYGRTYREVIVNILAVLAIALALSMDAFAVSVSASATIGSVTWKHYVRLAGAFGFFQFLMPVIGWALGVSVRSYIEAWDHWIAFALLALVGINMLREAFGGGEEEEKSSGDPSRGLQLFMLAVATSIDAMAVGLSFAVIGVSVWGPAILIGLVCAVVTASGVQLGHLLGRSKLLGSRISVLGGLVLIGIGVKILFEHGVC